MKLKFILILMVLVVVVNATTVTTRINIKQGGASQIIPAMYNGKIYEEKPSEGEIAAASAAEQSVKTTNLLLWAFLFMFGVPIVLYLYNTKIREKSTPKEEGGKFHVGKIRRNLEQENYLQQRQRRTEGDVSGRERSTGPDTPGDYLDIENSSSKGK